MLLNSPMVLLYLVFSIISIGFAVSALLKFRIPRLVLWTKSGPILLLTSAIWMLLEALGRLAVFRVDVILFIDRMELVAAFSLTFSWIAYVGELIKQKIKGYKLTLYIAGAFLVAGTVITGLNPYLHILWIQLENPDMANGLTKSYGSGFFFLMIGFSTLLLWGLIQLTRLHIKTFKTLTIDIKLFAVFSIVPIVLTLLEYFLSVRFFGMFRAAPFLFTLSIWLISWLMYVTRHHFLIRTSRKTVLENMDDAILVVDAHGLVVDLNAASIDLLHIASKREVLNLPVTDIWHDMAEVLKIDVDDGKTVQKEGRFFESLVSKIQDGRGNVVSRIIVLRDITERTRTEEAIRRYARELQSRNDELQQFAYVASHDLQEPLRMVSNYLGLLKRKYGVGLEKRAVDYIDFAVDGAQRMEKLLKDLLDYSRIGTREAKVEKIKMDEVVEDAKRNLKVFIDEHNTEINCRGLPVVFGDRSQFTQVFQNLISNAIKFGGKERVIEVDIGGRKSKHGVLLWVKDNGIGIEEDQQQRIFQIFQRLHTVEEYEGSGIGLAICKRVVERRGGTIWVESEIGKGSTFFFTIPTKDTS